MPYISSLRHAWPEKAGFTIVRKNGHPLYTFLHFYGSVELLVNGVLTVTRPHTCILFSPGVPQYFKSPQPLLHDWIHIGGELAPLLEAAALPTDTLLQPVRFDFITGLTREMESEFFTQKSGRERLLALKIEELIIKLARACTGEYSTAVDSTTEERFRKLRGELLSHLNFPWTAKEMASRVGLSESRFYSVYRGVYGTTPTDDLIRARIDAAKNALAFGNEPISLIAESLGYNNLSHFMRQFKKHTGFSPAQYRKKSGK